MSTSIYNKGLWQAICKVIKVFFHDQAFKLWLGIIMAAITTVCGLMLLGVSGWFITATYIVGFDYLAAGLFNVITPSAVIRFLSLARTAARYGERLATHDAALNVLASLREKLFRGWAKPDTARSLIKRPAQLLFRLTADIDALDSLYLRVIVPFAAALIALILVAIAYSVMISSILAIALIVWLVVMGMGVPILIALQSQRSSRRKAYAAEALRARVIDMTAGQIELLMAGQMCSQTQSILKADAYLNQADDQVNRLEVLISFVHGLASAFAMAGLLLVCATLNESAVIAAPIAAFALLVLLAVFEPFTALRRGAVEFGRTLLSIKRLAPCLDDETKTPEPLVPQHMVELESQGIVLQVSDVSFAYPQTDRKVLDHISLELKQGERIALIGSSGSGKSTLMALIAGELLPDQGEIYCAEHCILTQRTELFKDTIRGNLLLANPNATDEMLWQALEDAGLSTFIRQFPLELDTWLGEGGQGLSGGQARRLALARLLLRNASIWLLDEPTEGLDQQTAQDVLSRISIRNQHQSMLIATHIRREAEIADKIICIDEGQSIRVYQQGELGFQSALSQLNPK